MTKNNRWTQLTQRREPEILHEWYVILALIPFIWLFVWVMRDVNLPNAPSWLPGLLVEHFLLAVGIFSSISFIWMAIDRRREGNKRRLKE